MVAVSWRLGDGAELHLDASLTDRAVIAVPSAHDRQLHETASGTFAALADGRLPPMSAVVSITDAPAKDRMP
jgi:hypothetical protein